MTVAVPFFLKQKEEDNILIHPPMSTITYVIPAIKSRHADGTCRQNAVYNSSKVFRHLQTGVNTKKRMFSMSNANLCAAHTFIST